MSIFRKSTKFRKFNLLCVSSINVDVFRKLPEFGQFKNSGTFLQKTKKCSSWLRESVASLPSSLISYGPTICECWNLVKNAKMNLNDDSLAQCAVCKDVQTFAFISLYQYLKHKTQVYILRTLT